MLFYIEGVREDADKCPAGLLGYKEDAFAVVGVEHVDGPTVDPTKFGQFPVAERIDRLVWGEPSVGIE